MHSRKLLVTASSLFVCVIIAVLFQNCAPASDSGDPVVPTSPSSNSNLGGMETLYVGSYQEDALTNPEDPMPGIVYLNIPASGDFSGQMYFTYQGCQSSNIGWVSGSRQAQTLSGQWSGTLDKTNQSGGFAGSWIAAQSSFQGNYTVAGGKRRITVSNCVDYYIAPKGTFGLWPVGAMSPSNFVLRATAQGTEWSAISQSVGALIAIIDAEAALKNGANAIITQQFVMGATRSVPFSLLPLVSGKPYIATVLVLNSSGQAIARGSVPFRK